MKKIVMMLLGIAATINVMAVDFTAKATLLLTATSGESCEINLYQSDSYAALSGYDMYMSGRKVALYILKGTDKLQIAQAKDFTDVKLGLLTDASTDYTLTVSAVEGSETLYLWDGTSTSYALTEGAVYNFTAAANATDEARFVLKKAAMPTVKNICFNYNVLTLTMYDGETVEVYNYGTTTAAMAPVAVVGIAPFDIDLSALASGKYLVKIGAEEYVIDVKPAVTVVP